MSNFAKNTEKDKEQKQRAWERKLALSKLCHDLAKLTFAALILGQVILMGDNDADWRIMIIGIASTIMLIKTGNNFINNK